MALGAVGLPSKMQQHTTSHRKTSQAPNRLGPPTRLDDSGSVALILQADVTLQEPEWLAGAKLVRVREVADPPHKVAQCGRVLQSNSWDR